MTIEKQKKKKKNEAGNSPSMTSVCGTELLKSFNGGRFPTDSVRTKWGWRGESTIFALTGPSDADGSYGVEIEAGTWLQVWLVSGRVFKEIFQWQFEENKNRRGAN